jgi:mono/diheme cytochrome c family protein
MDGSRMCTRSLLCLPGLALILVIIAGRPLSAQLPTYGVGRTPSSDEIAASDIAIAPDGRELPPGGGTARTGKRVYDAKCAECHGQAGQGRPFPFPVLVGGRGTLATDEPLKTIGSYWPYATTVWDYINRAMPFQQPGSLSADDVYGVTAYLLYLNGIIGEDEMVDAASLPKVIMPNRGGFVRDPRPGLP